MEAIDREAAASAAASAERTADLQRTERALQSIRQQEELYPDDWIEDPEDSYYTPGGYFMDDLAVRIKALRVQLYREAGGAGVPPADLGEYHDVAKPAHRHDSIRAIKNSNNPIHAIPPWRELKQQVLRNLEERQKELRLQNLPPESSSHHDISDQHEKIRQRAAHSRELMKKKYGTQHQITIFNIGDLVLFPIPKSLRKATEISRIPGCIYKIRNRGYYEVRT